MRAAFYHLTIEQGVTFDIELQYTEEDGNPIDITGMTVRCQGRSTFASSGTLFDWSTTNSKITLSDPSNGIFKFSVSATDTAALSFTDGVYDIEIVNGSIVRRLLEGPVTLSREVTR